MNNDIKYSENKKLTNLKVPIHSCGGRFNIIAWTKRRKLLKFNK